MISRDELYELVWSTPMTKAAEKFEVSGSYLARVCSVLRLATSFGPLVEVKFGPSAEAYWTGWRCDVSGAEA